LAVLHNKLFHTKRLLLVKSVLLIISIFFNYTAKSQILGRDILGGKKSVTLPFQFVGGFIVVKVKYNNLLPLNFILDTGASNTILFDQYYASIFKTTFSDTIKVVGADIKSNIEGYIVRNGKFILPEMSSTTSLTRDYIVLSEDCIQLEKRIGKKIHGILGSDFLKRLTTQIDYQSEVVRLYNPEYFRPSKKTESLDAEIINGKPYVPVDIDLGSSIQKLKFLIDTGASISVIIHSNTDSLIQLPERSLPAYLGSGLSGEVEGHIGLLSKISIGKFSFDNLIASFQNIENPDSIDIIRNGLIGSVLLSKFTLTIDYTKSKLYLKPNKSFKKKIKTNKSGLVIHAFGEKLDQYIVQYVYPTSAGDIAGLKKGDILLKVNKCKTSKLSISRLLKRFRKKEGKVFRIKVYRDEEEIEKLLTLKELIK